MGSFAYCGHKGCEAGLNAPTPFEIAYDMWGCSLGHRNELRPNALAEAVLDLESRLEELQRRVENLELLT